VGLFSSPHLLEIFFQTTHILSVTSLYVHLLKPLLFLVQVAYALLDHFVIPRVKRTGMGFYLRQQIATIWWVGFSHLPGNIRSTHVECIPITTSWYPTISRPHVWLVEFWHLPVKWVFVALPIGMLVTLLFYYDHVRSFNVH
jgi:hypothetical protein